MTDDSQIQRQVYFKMLGCTRHAGCEIHACLSGTKMWLAVQGWTLMDIDLQVGWWQLAL